MKKKTYVQPEMKVAKLEQTEIICTSTEGLTLDDFDWGDDALGNFTESLTEDEFVW